MELGEPTEQSVVDKWVVEEYAGRQPVNIDCRNSEQLAVALAVKVVAEAE